MVCSIKHKQFRIYNNIVVVIQSGSLQYSKPTQLHKACFGSEKNTTLYVHTKYYMNLLLNYCYSYIIVWLSTDIGAS